MSTNPDVLRLAIYNAAIEWCGEKERETSMDDIRYFENNWRSLPGLTDRVERHLRQPEKGSTDE